MKWITPDHPLLQKIIAIAFSAIAGLVIVMDMGRPERLAYVFIYGRSNLLSSGMLPVIQTYFVLSFLLYFLPMIPDLAISHKKCSLLPGWAQTHL